jgi:hypothetical protein
VAGPGRIPKQTRSRKRDTARREAETITISDDGTLHGPDLPEGALPGGQDWHEQTRMLWRELRQHPLLRDEPGVTWQYLIDSCALHSVMWSRGRWDLASEIRLRLAKIAATPEDRQRMKVNITKHVPEAATPAGVSDLASRRARLTDST